MIEIKIPKISIEKLTGTAQRVGLVAMSAALTWSVLELPDEAKRAILPNQPVPVLAEAGQQNNERNSIRREREETAPHYISYSEIQRTPTRSGRS